MRLNNQILSNLKEDKEDWYYLCNDAEQALLKVKDKCTNEDAIKSLERMILDLNSIRMEQYKALNEYTLVEDEESNIEVGKIKNYLDEKYGNYRIINADGSITSIEESIQGIIDAYNDYVEYNQINRQEYSIINYINEFNGEYGCFEIVKN